MSALPSHPRPSREEGVRGAAERRILEAAQRRIETYGYRRTSMAEIARDAGIAVGTVYRYFESKEALLMAVVEDSSERWLAMAQEALAQPGTVIERLINLGAASVAHNQQSRLLGSILEKDTEILAPALLEELNEKLTRQNVELISELLREGIEDGSLRELDPDATAFILFVGGRALFNETYLPYQEVLPQYSDILLHGLLRPEQS